ncbi:hypothetical protein BaRGS_00011426 [Batillaria attramentaria]|uniref:Apple domain-containing protein n=1 Tax=Batillaria attramentaria TaxID=370345 RepID=A0ABD0LEF5_9CAEN
MESTKLLAFFCMFYTSSVHCAMTMRHMVATQQTQASGYVFADNLLWMKHVRSMINCHVLCTNDDACAAFTFTLHGVGVAGVCRAHDKAAGQNNTTWVSNPTTRSYRLPDRYYAEDAVLTTPAVIETTEAPCVSDGDCPDSSWICLQGKCLCQLGNYYSVGSDTCVSSCNTADLLNDFHNYGGTRLKAVSLLPPLIGWSPIFSYTLTEAQCEAFCVATSDCSAVNFDVGTQKCEGVPKGALLLSLSFFQSDASAVFKERVCK